MTDYTQTIQSALDYIDDNITDKIAVEDLARLSGYSVDYFYRIFNRFIGMPIMEYVTKRKLQYALFELSAGRRVIDIAMDYGFETHAGFTKAFKKCFGYPPNLYRIHAPVSKPQKIILNQLNSNKTGGIIMQPKIVTRETIKIVGYEFKTTMKNHAHTKDIPAYWNEIDFDGHGYEGKLYDSQNPPEHGEYGICVNVNTDTDDFSWVMGVAVENYDKLTPELCALEIPAATYAVFTTPPVDNDDFPASITGTWKYILDEWLPDSEYEMDETKLDFEFYDERCHYTLVDKVVMDIYIPIKPKM